MLNEYRIIRRPVVTEKGTRIKDDYNQLVFEVDPRSNKSEIKMPMIVMTTRSSTNVKPNLEIWNFGNLEILLCRRIRTSPRLRRLTQA